MNTRVAQLVEHSADTPSGVSREVGGSSPSLRTNLFSLKWAEELHCKTGVYNRRWYLETPLFSIRVHHWLYSDDDRHFHDHPWWFITFVLAGGYTDVTPNGRERMNRGMWAFRPALHKHTVQVDPGGCWTLVFTGPKIRKWGFWVKNKFKKANKYFLEHGQHVCK